MGKRILGLSTAVLLIGIVSFLAGRKSGCGTEFDDNRNFLISTFRDTTFVRDTVFLTKTMPTGESRIGHKEIIMPKAGIDTLANCQDSIKIELPEVSRKYEGEDFELWISGVDPRLDSLRIVRSTSNIVEKEIISPITSRQKTNRWSVGISAGIGLANGRLEPFIGIGVCYRLF